MYDTGDGLVLVMITEFNFNTLLPMTALDYNSDQVGKLRSGKFECSEPPRHGGESTWERDRGSAADSSRSAGSLEVEAVFGKTCGRLKAPPTHARLILPTAPKP